MRQFNGKEQINLGKLTSKILEIESQIRKGEQAFPEIPVLFDFGNFYPASLLSYRGFYDELAFEYESSYMPRKNPWVFEDFKHLLLSAPYNYYNGYKGGEYSVDSSTPLWASNWGEASQTAITGVSYHDQQLILHTGFMPSFHKKGEE